MPDDAKPSLLRHIVNASPLWDSSALRLGLYFAVACATTFLTQTEAVSTVEEFSALQWLRIVLASLVSGLVAVRAFLDTSVSRAQAEPPPG